MTDLSLLVAMSDESALQDFERRLGASLDDLALQIVPVLTDVATGNLFIGLRAGLQNSNGRYIALLDAKCPPTREWLPAVATAIKSGTAIFYGPVTCDLTGSNGRVMAYVDEYVQFMPPIDPEMPEIPGNNLVFSRSLIADDDLRSNEFYKTFFVSRLYATGVRPVLVPVAVVQYEKDHGIAQYVRRRFAHGRNFAARRRVRAPLLLALSCPAIWLLRISRLFRWTRHKRSARDALWRVLPSILLAEAAWSLGESVGYLAGPSTQTRYLN